ncbi:hypothetical protein BU17DRAFT_66871 [Hysterangium stoloniferum]|nr:hypothetical protein BU17DRAFT_66871 [Hysterangium stoloniferum]
MQNHNIAHILGRCPSKEYHELYLGNKLCSCGLSPKSHPSKVENASMCIGCGGVPFTTRKNGIRHASNAERIHEYPTCHDFFFCVSTTATRTRKIVVKKGQGFSRGV